MSGFKMWDDFTQKEIRDKYKHVNGILYHLKDSGKNGRWYKAGDPVKVYKNSRGYLCFKFWRSDGYSLVIKVHRVVWYLEHGTQVKMIDHVDRNRENNAPDNLRVSTSQENAFNRGKLDGCKSKYKGVIRTQNNKWCAQISINRRKVHLGVFLDEVDAAKAYDEAAKEHFGDYASLNF